MSAISDADRRLALALTFAGLSALFYFLGNPGAGAGFLGAASALGGSYAERVRVVR